MDVDDDSPIRDWHGPIPVLRRGVVPGVPTVGVPCLCHHLAAVVGDHCDLDPHKADEKMTPIREKGEEDEHSHSGR